MLSNSQFAGGTNQLSVLWHEEAEREKAVGIVERKPAV